MVGPVYRVLMTTQKFLRKYKFAKRIIIRRNNSSSKQCVPKALTQTLPRVYFQSPSTFADPSRGPCSPNTLDGLCPRKKFSSSADSAKRDAANE